MRDLPIRSVEDLKDAACHVAMLCFAEGVFYFDLRFNPYKKSLTYDRDGILGGLRLGEHLEQDC